MRCAMEQRAAILASFRNDFGKGRGSGMGARMAEGWLRVENKNPVVGVREKKLSRTANSKIPKSTGASIVDVDAFAQARPAPLPTTLVLRPMEATWPPCDSAHPRLGSKTPKDGVSQAVATANFASLFPWFESASHGKLSFLICLASGH